MANNRLSILLVEDSHTNRIITKEFFKHLGYHNVDAVENGKEALEHTKKKQYDIMFIDLNMPVMDGLTASKQIYQQNNRPIIILLTADAFIEIENIPEIDDKLSKPVRMNTLQQMIEKWIQEN